MRTMLACAVGALAANLIACDASANQAPRNPPPGYSRGVWTVPAVRTRRVARPFDRTFVRPRFISPGFYYDDDDELFSYRRPRYALEPVIEYRPVRRLRPVLLDDDDDFAFSFRRRRPLLDLGILTIW